MDKVALLAYSALIFVLILCFLASTIGFESNVEGLVRLLVFCTMTTVSLFLVPKLVSAEAFLRVITRFSAVVVIVGLPTAIVGSYTIAGLTVTPHPFGFNLPLPFLPNQHVSPITSILDNPNVLGYLAVIGFVGGLAEFQLDGISTSTSSLILLNGIGAYLTGSRAAALLLAFSTVFFIVMRFSGRRVAIAYTGATVFGLILLFTNSIGPEIAGPLPEVNLKSREYLWPAAVEAILESPATGYGVGERKILIDEFVTEYEKIQTTHNSYLRIGLNAGITGLVAYIVLFVRGFQTALTSRNQEALAVVIGVLGIHQLFAAYSIFGIAFNSVLAAIFLGYSLNMDQAPLASDRPN